ncbi:hypothetical protein MANES_08G008702v8 [Manihot esculenta]|uniref:Uncharacterized protein n=3 Tax=Manihot esculenta TaxID=3983 RepID=A0A2C9VCC6_MANES|nr:hypothetical protein MANES_08G008702v8 [Manihot esculenta]KAG8648542.1 hypothetical protein MANES_08G008702v8 [Manihot esculenta]OAY42695.1 hypothetical protein MANES_08G008702v8 [Manihot esculenta]
MCFWYLCNLTMNAGDGAMAYNGEEIKKENTHKSLVEEPETRKSMEIHILNLTRIIPTPIWINFLPLSTRQEETWIDILSLCLKRK